MTGRYYRITYWSVFGALYCVSLLQLLSPLTFRASRQIPTISISRDQQVPIVIAEHRELDLGLSPTDESAGIKNLLKIFDEPRKHPFEPRLSGIIFGVGVPQIILDVGHGQGRAFREGDRIGVLTVGKISSNSVRLRRGDIEIVATPSSLPDESAPLPRSGQIDTPPSGPIAQSNAGLQAALVLPLHEPQENWSCTKTQELLCLE